MTHLVCINKHAHTHTFTVSARNSKSILLIFRQTVVCYQSSKIIHTISTGLQVDFKFLVVLLASQGLFIYRQFHVLNSEKRLLMSGLSNTHHAWLYFDGFVLFYVFQTKSSLKWGSTYIHVSTNSPKC